jgi:hypothetical protein
VYNDGQPIEIIHGWSRPASITRLITTLPHGVQLHTFRWNGPTHLPAILHLYPGETVKVLPWKVKEIGGPLFEMDGIEVIRADGLWRWPWAQLYAVWVWIVQHAREVKARMLATAACWGFAGWEAGSFPVLRWPRWVKTLLRLH